MKDYYDNHRCNYITYSFRVVITVLVLYTFENVGFRQFLKCHVENGFSPIDHRQKICFAVDYTKILKSGNIML